MKYARTFAALALLCALGASQSASAPAAACFGWSALSCFVLSLAYATRRPRLLGKRSDGTLGWAQVLALTPYHALNTLSYTLACRFSREKAADEIVPGLWLGRRLNRRDGSLIASIGPLSVLDAAAEMPELKSLRAGSVKYLSLPLLDTGAPTPEQLRLAAGWIGERLERGPVLVHCALGHGRSATLVAAFLLRSERAATVEEALEIIRARRARIEPSCEQARALQVLEAALWDSKTRS